MKPLLSNCAASRLMQRADTIELVIWPLRRPRRPHGNPRRWSQALLPARLLARPQPDRAGVRQNETLLREADARTKKTPGGASARSPTASPPPNAPTTSEAQDTLQPASETILCSDGAGIYRTYAEHAEIAHRPINVAAGDRTASEVAPV